MDRNLKKLRRQLQRKCNKNKNFKIHWTLRWVKYPAIIPCQVVRNGPCIHLYLIVSMQMQGIKGLLLRPRVVIRTSNFARGACWVNHSSQLSFRRSVNNPVQLGWLCHYIKLPPEILFQYLPIRFFCYFKLIHIQLLSSCHLNLSELLVSATDARLMKTKMN